MSELLLILVLGGAPTAGAAWFFRVVTRKEVLLGDSREARAKAEADAEAARDAAEWQRARQAETWRMAEATRAQLSDVLEVARDDVGAVGRGVTAVDAKVHEVAAMVAELRERGAGAGGLENLDAKVEQVLSLISAQAQERDVATQMEQLLGLSQKVQELREEFRAGRGALSGEEAAALKGLLADQAPRGRHTKDAQLYVLPGADAGDGAGGEQETA